MYIYAVADIHGAQYRVNEIRDIIDNHTPDVVCICGDITQFGPGDMATMILNQLPGTIFVVPGNIDTPDVNQGIKGSHAKNIQFKKIEFNSKTFLGLNGVSEKETYSFFNNPLNKSLFKNIDVLLTHVPPYGFQDTVFLGKHAGSKLILEIMDAIDPRLLLCGHIHEDPGYIKTDSTVIVNCSMGKRGRGALIDFADEITVTMIQ